MEALQWLQSYSSPKPPSSIPSLFSLVAVPVHTPARPLLPRAAWQQFWQLLSPRTPHHCRPSNTWICRPRAAAALAAAASLQPPPAAAETWTKDSLSVLCSSLSPSGKGGSWKAAWLPCLFSGSCLLPLPAGSTARPPAPAPLLSQSPLHPPSLTLAVTKWELYAVSCSMFASALKYTEASESSWGIFLILSFQKHI